MKPTENRFTFKFVLLFFLLLQITSPSIYAQSSSSFTELVGFSGGMFKPKGAPTLGLEMGLGFGKNIIGVEFAHESLGNYSPGIGGTSLLACTSGCPIPPFEITYSNSADFRVNLNYSRDFYHGSRFMVYGIAGGGYLRSTWTGILNCSNCVPNFYNSSTISYQASSVAGAFGGGIRIPMTERAGIRVELKEWVNRPTTSQGMGANVNTQVVTNHVVGTTIGFYYRWLGLP